MTVTTEGFQDIGKEAAEGLREGIVGIADAIKSVATRPEYQEALGNMVETINEGIIKALNQLGEGNFAGATQEITSMGVELARSTGLLDAFNKGLEALVDKFTGLPFVTPTSTDDVLMGPAPGKVISSPEGTFKLNEKDSLIAGTNLFGGQTEKIQKLEFANSAEVNIRGSIQVNGIPNNVIGQSLLRDPDFVSGIRSLFGNTIKEQLGRA